MIMKYVDAHIHLSDPEYADCIDEVITEARNAKVVAMVSNSVDLKTSEGNLKLAGHYPGLVHAALGVHPWNIQTITEEEIQQTTRLIEENRQNKALVAIGEIGIDSKYMSIWEKQINVFDGMLRLAEKLDLPVIIHSRGTTAQIVDMLPSYRLRKVLLHWFSNPISALAKAIDSGYYISEGPPTVYSNGIQDVVRRAPLSNLLTETDGPVRYFRKPFDGKRTTPAYMPMVINAIAEIKKQSQTDVAAQVVRNFEEFFGIKLN
jgi:TatD DNase family protein